MSTYYLSDLKSRKYIVLKSGDSMYFSCTKTREGFYLNKGTYKLLAYGGQGGDSSRGGKGGEAYGSISIVENLKMYVSVGECGQKYTKSGIYQGAYSWGGWCGRNSTSSNGSKYCGSGGGATYFCLSNTELWNSSKSDLLLIAGGGGGGGNTGSTYGNGGKGGGANKSGSDGSSNLSSWGYGGTLTSAGYRKSAQSKTYWNGSYGKGNTSSQTGSIYCGGGQGLYGGGSGVAGAGGGSGYANTSHLYSIGGSSGVNSGNGYAIVTCLSSSGVISLEPAQLVKFFVGDILYWRLNKWNDLSS